MTTTAPAGALWFTLAAIVRQLVRVGALKNGLAQVVKAFDRAVTRIVVAISFWLRRNLVLRCSSVAGNGTRKRGEREGEYSYRKEQLESRPSKKIRGGAPDADSYSTDYFFFYK